MGRARFDALAPRLVRSPRVRVDHHRSCSCATCARGCSTATRSSADRRRRWVYGTGAPAGAAASGLATRLVTVERRPRPFAAGRPRRASHAARGGRRRSGGTSSTRCPATPPRPAAAELDATLALSGRATPRSCSRGSARRPQRVRAGAPGARAVPPLAGAREVRGRPALRGARRHDVGGRRGAADLRPRAAAVPRRASLPWSTPSSATAGLDAAATGGAGLLPGGGEGGTDRAGLVRRERKWKLRAWQLLSPSGREGMSSRRTSPASQSRRISPASPVAASPAPP